MSKKYCISHWWLILSQPSLPTLPTLGLPSMSPWQLACSILSCRSPVPSVMTTSLEDSVLCTFHECPATELVAAKGGSTPRVWNIYWNKKLKWHDDCKGLYNTNFSAYEAKLCTFLQHWPAHLTYILLCPVVTQVEENTSNCFNHSQQSSPGPS